MSEISEKTKVRILGGGLADKPAPLAPAAEPARAPVAPAPAGKPLFLADTADSADLLDTALIVQPLAHLCATPQVQTPFVAAVAGPAGAGKTFALKRLAQEIEAVARTSGGLTRTVVARVDAANDAEAPVALATAAYAALDQEPGGTDYSALLDESGHAGGDPLRAATAAADRHEELVRKLEAERAQLDEVEARRARLANALLFETPGSRIDVFTRSRRGAIESRLRRFDLAGADPAASYRELVRDVAAMGPGGRLSIALRAVTAFGGQRRLLLWAVVAFAIGVALSMLAGGAAQSVAPGLGEPVQAAAGWVGANAGAFRTAAGVLYALAALLLVWNLWRAMSFSNLLFRGVSLLNHDLRDRKRDLDARAARLNQRVAGLAADAEKAAAHAEAAARRAGAKAASRGPGPEFLEASHAPATAARAFLAAVSERIARGRSEGTPDRLVFLVDNLDALPPDSAVDWIEAARGAIGPGAMAVLGLDLGRLVEPLGGASKARRRFEKWLQAVVNLPGRSGLDGERLMARLIATDGQPVSTPIDPKIGAAMAEPLNPAETALLTALAPLAAHSARGAKRFLNAYRLARASNAPRPAVALMLAVAFADDEARSVMQKRLASDAGELSDVEGPEELVKAVKSARAANNGPISVADARTAEAIARRYALPT